jgi:hypothetical protein
MYVFSEIDVSRRLLQYHFGRLCFQVQLSAVADWEADNNFTVESKRALY